MFLFLFCFIDVLFIEKRKKEEVLRNEVSDMTEKVIKPKKKMLEKSEN